MILFFCSDTNMLRTSSPFHWPCSDAHRSEFSGLSFLVSSASSDHEVISFGRSNQSPAESISIGLPTTGPCNLRLLDFPIPHSTLNVIHGVFQRQAEVLFYPRCFHRWQFDSRWRKHCPLVELVSRFSSTTVAGIDQYRVSRERNSNLCSQAAQNRVFFPTHCWSRLARRNLAVTASRCEQDAEDRKQDVRSLDDSRFHRPPSETHPSLIFAACPFFHMMVFFTEPRMLNSWARPCRWNSPMNWSVTLYPRIFTDFPVSQL